MALGVYSMEAVSILSQHSCGDKISYKNLPVKGLRCINVLSTKLLIEDTILMSPTADGILSFYVVIVSRTECLQFISQLF